METWTVGVKSLALGDSGVNFCSVSKHADVRKCKSWTKVNFTSCVGKMWKITKIIPFFHFPVDGAGALQRLLSLNCFPIIWRPFMLEKQRTAKETIQLRITFISCHHAVSHNLPLNQFCGITFLFFIFIFYNSIIINSYYKAIIVHHFSRKALDWWLPKFWSKHNNHLNSRCYRMLSHITR